MTPLFPAQRAAEEFDQVLTGTADTAVADRYAELFDAVEQLRAIPEVTPRAEFVGDLRARLMTAAESELVVVPAAVRSLPEERTRRRNRRLGTLAASLVVVGGTAGMAAAANGSLPGETLYPIKRGIEQVTAAARFDDASQGKALLGQATTRLEEVRALQAQGTADPDLVAETVDAFNRAADEGSAKLFTSYQAGGDQADINAVRDFTATQMADVDDLSASADTVTDDLLLGAADTLADIDQQARALCGVCGPGEALAPPEALSSGAGAATMATLIARPVSQAQSDIDAATAAKLRKLKGQAETKAGDIPIVLPGSGGTTTPGLPGTTGDPGEPLKSIVTPDGQLLPTIKSGAAVDDLVDGVTKTLDEVTGGTGATAPLTDPLGKVVKDLGKAVGGATGSILP